MKIKVVTLIISAVMLLAGVAYGTQTEVTGGLSVYSGKYVYVTGNVTLGELTPRCQCDSGLSQECPLGSFFTDTDQGDFCYDQFSSGPVYSRLYTRNPGSETFVVTNGGVGAGTANPAARFHVAGGDFYMSTTNTGIILKATDGPNCFRVTINNAGILQQTPVDPCP